MTDEKEVVYIFLDEGGNLDFSKTGTKYFSLSSVTIKRPFKTHTQLDTYKYNLVEYGIGIEHFHCSEDNSYIKGKVFSMIGDLKNIQIDSVLVEKSKTMLHLQEIDKFYPRMMGYLLKYVLEESYQENIKEFVIITDSIPIKRKKEVVRKTIQKTLKETINKKIKYRIYHHKSMAHYNLQIADYCNWAIFKKWESDETLFYDKIKSSIRSEFDIFQLGKERYY
jgi:hypothetical protein